MPAQKFKDADYFIRILRQHVPEIKKKYSVSYLGHFRVICPWGTNE